MMRRILPQMVMMMVILTLTRPLAPPLITLRAAVEGVPCVCV
jgi:hypothetical protein